MHTITSTSTLFRALADLGLGRGDVAREASKPFWQP